MNKKAEGTASSFVLASVIAVSVLALFSLLVVDMVGSYREHDSTISDINDFEPFTAIYDDLQDDTNDFVGSQNANESNIKESGERTEDSIFTRGLKSIPVSYTHLTLPTN